MKINILMNQRATWLALHTAVATLHNSPTLPNWLRLLARPTLPDVWAGSNSREEGAPTPRALRLATQQGSLRPLKRESEPGFPNVVRSGQDACLQGHLPIPEADSSGPQPGGTARTELFTAARLKGAPPSSDASQPDAEPPGSQDAGTGSVILPPIPFPQVSAGSASEGVLPSRAGFRAGLDAHPAASRVSPWSRLAPADFMAGPGSNWVPPGARSGAPDPPVPSAPGGWRPGAGSAWGGPHSRHGPGGYHGGAATSPGEDYSSAAGPWARRAKRPGPQGQRDNPLGAEHLAEHPAEQLAEQLAEGWADHPAEDWAAPKGPLLRQPAAAGQFVGWELLAQLGALGGRI